MNGENPIHQSLVVVNNEGFFENENLGVKVYSQTFNNVLANVGVKAIVDIDNPYSTNIPSIIKPRLINNV